ncbi:kelch repeat and BTB domain-containing protein 8-like [Branchiostoma floridae]|uniref:Kelch repeat and BTB domain-containing protein 8-like n=1 Tax=Branchiostoma floridae TaxID=7739 RepID=A0A9J7MR03_BRAFL|nr:kelch repeat and BTB domain-containing protein 8-like [Branchiostoma floridae]
MFGEILSYVYSGTLHVSLDKVQPLYQAADLLQLDYVRDTCSNYMAMNVERSTCVDLYKFADVYSVDIVRKACLLGIASQFTEFSFTIEFCSLTVNQLTEIISHDELDVKEETAVWEAVVRWVQHSRENRLPNLPSILPHIRFNLLTLGDRAAILEHPLVREDPGSSEVISNVVQKGNPDLKPRLGMFTEMALLPNQASGANDVIFINPLERKYISCSYRNEDLPDSTAMTVTSDNNIYVLTREQESNNKLSMFKYNHAGNVWEDAGMSSISMEYSRYNRKYLIGVNGILCCLFVDVSEGDIRMIKYNQGMDQWQECSQQIDITEYYDYYVALSCGSFLYFLTSSELHRYDPSQDRWSKRTSPGYIPEVCTAVAMGTEIFCTDMNLTQTMVYDTELDCWQKLQGWPNPGNFDIDNVPSLFAMGNQLHIFLTCCSDSQEGFINLVYVYDRSADTWTDMRATLPNTEYFTYGFHCPVARIYLSYLRGA